MGHSLEPGERNQSKLLALFQASQTIFRARTSAGLYQAIHEHSALLGYQITGMEWTTDHKFRIMFTGYPPDLVRKAEKLTGFSIQDYEFSPRKNSIYQQVLFDKEAVFVHDGSRVVAETMPHGLRNLALPIVKEIGINSVAVAPLLVGEEVLGLLILTSPDLAESDLPLIAAFANLAASAIQNARYFESAQEEIARHKRSEEILRKAEERYRLISKAVSDYVFSTVVGEDGSLKLNWVAGAFEAITGYTFDEYTVHGGWQAAVHPDDRQIDRRDLEALRKNKKIISELRTVKKDGRITWVRVYAHPVWDEQSDRLAGIYGAVQSIETQKQAEAMLRESEERYRSLFDRMMDGVYRSSHEGKFVDVNPAMVKMFGFSNKEEMLEVDIKNELYFSPEERGSHILDTGREEMDVYRMRRKDGSEIWVEDHGYYLHDELGNITFHEGMLREVTERKRIEDALAASEAELRALFASMEDVVLVIDKEGFHRKIAPTNPGLLYKSPEQLLGKNLKDVFPAEKAEAFCAVVKQVLDSNQNAQIEYDLVIGGRPVWFQATISPLNQDSTLWVAHDITNRKQAEKDLQESHDRMLKVLDSIPADVYIADMNTYEILFMNQHMRNSFGDKLVGQVCWQVFRGESGPCPHCTNAQLVDPDGNPTGVVVWEGHNPISRRWYSNYDRAIHWIGEKLVRVQIAVDITERKQVEEELRNAKDAFETANLELQQSLEREKLLASTDGLTGLCNRRHFFELAARDFHAAVRHHRPLTFLMFDIDDFKQVNDTLGHTVGDKLLEKVAHTTISKARSSDVVARYGGDEFIIMLSNTSAQHALPVAERIRASVANILVKLDKESVPITLSIGIAETRHDPVDENVERVINRADIALYKAKQGGRNRTIIFGREET